MKTRWLAAAALLTLAACKEDPPPQKEAPPDASAPAVDSKLKQALTAEPMAVGSAPAGEGPPPNGVFESGAADKAHAKGAPPSLEVIDKGSEPRAVLRPPIHLSEPHTLRLLVGHSSGDPRGQNRSVLPNVVYTLRAAPPKAQKEPAEEEAAPSGPQPLVLTIAEVAMAEDQPGEIPPQLQKLIEQVKGSRIETTILPSGALHGIEVSYGDSLKEAAVRTFVDNLADVVPVFFSPYPEQPIGKGGYWISHDRLEIQKLDLVRYRVTKLEEMKGDEMVLSVQIRHYLAGGDIGALVRSIAGRDQPGIVAAGFDSTGAAELTRKKDALLPISGEARTPFVLVLAAGGNPQQAQPIQFDLQARLMPPEAPKD